MSCKGCSSGRGCGSLPAGCKNNGSCGTGGCNKLDVFDWLTGMNSRGSKSSDDIVEVRFKNDRKDFFRTNGKELNSGDIVAVEAGSGHDIGIVSLTGELVTIQMKRKKSKKQQAKKIYRKAEQKDIDVWIEARENEQQALVFARKESRNHNLKMKVSDVEYQGDNTKATFYYTADNRIDFRELVKKLSSKLKVRIDMRQIGARQEAAKVGGIGSCGRELCCSTWLTDFRSVSTSAARYQQLSINPMKIAGQCGKLKCCLNFELDAYMDVLKDFPNTNTKLKTKKGTAFHLKTDVFKRTLWYSYEGESLEFIPLKVDRANEIISQNKKGVFPESLKDFASIKVEEKQADFENVVGQDSITRFDNRKKKKGGNKKRKFWKGKKKNAPQK